jgi:hypothetical protein
MSGDPLRDLDCAARIHVFGDARRTEAVTTNSFFRFSGSRWPSPDFLGKALKLAAELYGNHRRLHRDGFRTAGESAA